MATLSSHEHSDVDTKHDIVYKAIGRRLYVAVAPHSWKARHVAADGHVAMTVPVRRGGLLSLVFPIPPATISFHARATVHPAGSPDLAPILKEMASLLPAGHHLASSQLCGYNPLLCARPPAPS